MGHRQPAGAARCCLRLPAFAARRRSSGGPRFDQERRRRAGPPAISHRSMLDRNSFIGHLRDPRDRHVFAPLGVIRSTRPWPSSGRSRGPRATNPVPRDPQGTTAQLGAPRPPSRDLAVVAQTALERERRTPLRERRGPGRRSRAVVAGRPIAARPVEAARARAVRWRAARRGRRLLVGTLASARCAPRSSAERCSRRATRFGPLSATRARLRGGASPEGGLQPH
jgi:hypothetical protein